jgi:hypothetical protein
VPWRTSFDILQEHALLHLECQQEKRDEAGEAAPPGGVYSRSSSPRRDGSIRDLPADHVAFHEDEDEVRDLTLRILDEFESIGIEEVRTSSACASRCRAKR